MKIKLLGRDGQAGLEGALDQERTLDASTSEVGGQRPRPETQVRGSEKEALLP